MYMSIYVNTKCYIQEGWMWCVRYMCSDCMNRKFISVHRKVWIKNRGFHKSCRLYATDKRAELKPVLLWCNYHFVPPELLHTNWSYNEIECMHPLQKRPGRFDCLKYGKCDMCVKMKYCLIYLWLFMSVYVEMSGIFHGILGSHPFRSVQLEK